MLVTEQRHQTATTAAITDTKTSLERAVAAPPEGFAANWQFSIASSLSRVLSLNLSPWR